MKVFHQLLPTSISYRQMGKVTHACGWIMQVHSQTVDSFACNFATQEVYFI
jgi:hypothetical protein